LYYKRQLIDMTPVFNFIHRGPGRNEVFEIRTRANAPAKLTTSATSRLLDVTISNPNGRKWVTGRVDVDAVALPTIRKVVDRILEDFAAFRPDLSDLVELEIGKAQTAGSMLRVTVAPGPSSWKWASPPSATGILPAPEELNGRIVQGAFGLVFGTITCQDGRALYLNISLKTAAVGQIEACEDQLADMELSFLDDNASETVQRSTKKRRADDSE